MTDITKMFPKSYEESRDRFCAYIEFIKKTYPDAQLTRYHLEQYKDLTIDWIQADALKRKEKLLIISLGEHGIEAFVGSAIMHLFMQEFFQKLNPENTGLLLIHPINPWGMKNHRRVNANNVDLNRNFGWNPDTCNSTSNPDYLKLKQFLLPERPLGNYQLNSILFIFKLIWNILLHGKKRLMTATLLGQYSDPQGIYNGGDHLQEETRFVTDLYRHSFSQYSEVVHIDNHTGYGPRYQMSVVNSYLEPESSEVMAKKFNYPLIVKSNPQEFYAILGDMIDFEYKLARQEFPDLKFYATAFEFGTLGDSLPATIRAMRTSIFENQAHWYGTVNDNIQRRIEKDYTEAYAPVEENWRIKALADARQAISGILSDKGYIH